MATAAIRPAHASQAVRGPFGSARSIRVICGGCARTFRTKARPLTIRGKQVASHAPCPSCQTTNIA